MQGNFLLGRQCVRRGAHQQCVGLDFLGVLGESHGVFGADATGADDQWQAASQHVLGLGGQVDALLGGVGVVLAGGATNDDAVDFRLDQVFEDLGERRLVDRAVRSQRSDCRGVDAFEFHGRFSSALLSVVKAAADRRCGGSS
ncbi:hypothetical protein D3C78_572440 [compost metagenome]